MLFNVYTAARGAVMHEVNPAEKSPMVNNHGAKGPRLIASTEDKCSKSSGADVNVPTIKIAIEITPPMEMATIIPIIDCLRFFP